MRVLLLLVGFVAACSAQSCEYSDELQALPLSFKSHQNHVIFGKLTACPRGNEALSDSLRFIITAKDNVRVFLLNDRLGDFFFTPDEDFVGTVTFHYHVEDDNGESGYAEVTIQIQSLDVPPSLTVPRHVIGLEDNNVELDIAMDDGDNDRWADASIAICNCAHDVTCDRETEDCHCHLSMPDGWQIFDGDRQLSLEELSSLTPTTAQNLVLKAAPSSAAEHCMDIHVLDKEQEEDPSISKKELNIHIHPINTVLMKPQPAGSAPIPPQSYMAETPKPTPLNFTTVQGRPLVFHDLQIVDVDGAEGSYFVTVRVDQGGVMWIRQDLREDVVFLPWTDEIEPEEVSTDKVYEQQQCMASFRNMPQPLPLESASNGVKLLRFIGSLEGINEVLSTLTYIPWCASWPTPPSWPVPTKSWMNVPMDPPVDPRRPPVWPQWYPRFWYPFYEHHWTWWPRVLPPWWITTVCQANWTSAISVRVQELPSVSCQQTKEGTVAEWSANITVVNNTTSPKSLITYNHFTYISPEARSVNLDSVYLRSHSYNLGMNITFNISILEADVATVVFQSTGLNYTNCSTVEECNRELKKINVTFRDGVQDVCHITVQIDMHQNMSSKLLDRLVLWVVNTTRVCADVTATYPDFQLTSKDDVVVIGQGSTDHPVHLQSNLDIEGAAMPGILHVKLYAEHGVITVKVPDGMRIYSDHMGQHEGIPSYLSLAGSVTMVMEALARVRFTPFQFRGETAITVEYRLPSTVSRLLTGEVMPFRRLRVPISVVGGVTPYMPVILRPQELCVNEASSIHLNMTTVFRRFREDEPVTFSVTPGIGSLQVDTADKALYNCPVLEEEMHGMCAERCSHDGECSGSQLCCSNGCGHTCIDGTLRANIQVLNTGQITMVDYTSTISQMIVHNAIKYIPAPCIGDEMKSYTDTIQIGVIPSRNPEGDSARAVIPVQVNCSQTGPVAIPLIQDVVDNCEWSEWTSCQTQEVCGQGLQQRRKLCNSEDVLETRPCVNCSCAPAPIVVESPQPSLEGCVSEAPVPQCPQGCSVTSSRSESISFLCQPHSGEEHHGEEHHGEGESSKELETREAVIQLHDACSCSFCDSYQTQE